MAQTQQTTKAKSKNKLWIWTVIIVVLVAAAAAFGFTKLIQWSGSTAENLLAQAEKNIAAEKYQAALGDLYSVTTLEGVQSDDASRAYLLLGQLYDDRGQLDLAFENYQAAVEADGANIEATIGLLDLALRYNNTELVDQYLEKLVKRHAGNGAVQIMKARWAWSQGSSETDELFAQAYELAPADPFVLVYTTLYRSRTDQTFAKNAAHKFSELKDSEEWQEIFETVTKYVVLLSDVQENIPYYAALLGQVFLEMDDLKLAEVILREAIEANEEYRDGYIFLGEALRRLNDFTAAQENIQKAIGLDPIYGYSFYVYGLWAADQENWDQAIEMLEQALDLEYENNAIRETLADYYYRAEKPEGIQAQYDALWSAGNIDWAAQEDLIVLLLQFPEQYDQAHEYINQILSVSSRWGGLAIEAYYLYLTDGDPEQIEIILETSFKAADNSALAYYVQGLYHQDVESLQRALDLDTRGHVAELATQALSEL